MDIILNVLAGLFAANSVPHFVHGVSGKPFRTPFVRLTGTKVNGPVVNVLWSWANLAAAYLLVSFATTNWQLLPFVAGAFCASLALALIFSRTE
jgi:hypothetical protein